MSRLSRFHAELDRLFDEAIRLASHEPRAGEHEPPVDVVETEREVVVLIEVPGLEPAELELFVEGRVLVLTGTKRHAAPGGARRFHRIEREQGRFECRVQMLRPVNTHQGRARLAEGLLRVAFPKIEEKRSGRHRLEIEESDGAVERETAGAPGDETT